MTWIRLDLDFPDHELIGALAEKLRMDPDRAAMSLIRVWCKFGKFSPAGMTNEITDTTIEDWAKWRGPRGRFALAFREYCCESDGKLKGWWRQEALLRHQEAKRHNPGGQRYLYVMRRSDGAVKIGVSRDPDKRLRDLQKDGASVVMVAMRPGSYPEEKQVHQQLARSRLEGEWFRDSVEVRTWLNGWQKTTGETTGENHPGAAKTNGVNAGYVDGDVNGSSTNQPVGSSRLVNRLGRDPDRFTVMGLFEHMPPEENPETWSMVLLACLDGIGLPGGRPATIHQLAVACTDYPAVVKSGWSPAHFRGCVKRAMRSDVAVTSKVGKQSADHAIKVAQEWASGGAG